MKQARIFCIVALHMIRWINFRLAIEITEGQLALAANRACGLALSRKRDSGKTRKKREISGMETPRTLLPPLFSFSYTGYLS